MKQITVYRVLCVAGVIFPWLFILGFFSRPDASITLFMTSIFANQVATAVAADLIVSAVVFFGYVFYEGRSLGMKHLWMYVPATLFVGLSFGLPLFLLMRARKLESRS